MDIFVQQDNELQETDDLLYKTLKTAFTFNLSTITHSILMLKLYKHTSLYYFVDVSLRVPLSAPLLSPLSLQPHTST